MSTYAKVTCRGCKIRRPAPEMKDLLITPVSVNGKPLAQRFAPYCSICYPIWQRHEEDMERIRMNPPVKRKPRSHEKPFLWHLGFFLRTLFKGNIQASGRTDKRGDPTRKG